MRLAVITSHINKSLQWQWTSEGYLRRGVEHIHIIINEEPPLLKKDLENLGVKVYWLPHRNFSSHLANLLKTIRILRRHNIGIVHTSLPYGNLIGQTAAMLCGIRNRITTCENASWAHDFKSRRQEMIDRWTYWLARKVIATSKPAADYLERHWDISRDKLVTIGHALKPDEFQAIAPERVERLKHELGIADQDYVAGVVARFEYWKGHAHIVEAVRMIANDHPDLKVLIFGSKGSDYRRIAERIAEYGLSDAIQHKGFTDDPLALYRLFNIHIHVPVNEYVETFGINIIEGMLSGCAQILTRSGVACSSARHKHNCLVVDYCDPKAIAQAIVELKTNPDLARRLGRQAHQDALKNFDIQAKIDSHLRLYNEIAEAPAIAVI